MLNPGGLGDSVSDHVDFTPWAQSPVGIGENPNIPAHIKRAKLPATIFSGPLDLPRDKKYKIFDITGRMIEPDQIQPGIYFITIDDKTAEKIIKLK